MTPEITEQIVKVVTANTEQGRTLLNLCNAIINKMDTLESNYYKLLSAHNELSHRVSLLEDAVDSLKVEDSDRIQ